MMPTITYRSGSNVDVCVIEQTKTEMLRNYRRPNERGSKEQRYTPKAGTTGVLRKEVWSLVTSTEVIDLPAPTEPASAMEVDKD